MIFTKKKIIILSILIITAIGLWFWFSGSKTTTIKVESVPVENVSVRETVSASGIINSQNYATLNFLSSGTLKRINANEGDQVQQNQILATLDSYSVSQTAKAAKDARDIALRNKDLFIEQYAEDKDLIGGEDQYQIRLRILNEEISKSEATYNSQLGNITNLNMRAPFDGTIVEVLKKRNEPVSLSEVVMKIADLTDLYFELDLDQEDFGKVNIGDAVEVELDAYPNEIFYGKVIELPTYINSSSATGNQLEVKIKLDSTDKNILLGMAGDGTVVTQQTSDTVQSLPFDAIFIDDDNLNYIWILDNNYLKRKYVEVGIEGDVYTEVIDNLDGLTVVIPSDSGSEIKEGDKGQISNK